MEKIEELADVGQGGILYSRRTEVAVFPRQLNIIYLFSHQHWSQI